MAGMDDVPGFRDLDPSERARLARATHQCAAEAGRILFSEGQPADDVWAVKEGVVHIVKFGSEGRGVVLEIIPPGELFGAVAALDRRPYPASAVAAERSVVWRLPATVARELCERNPALRLGILEHVTGRLRGAHDRLRSVALERVEQRLARALLTLGQRIGRQEGALTLVSVTRRELAEMVGTTVETTIRVTSKWQQEGIVTSARSRLGLADTAALRRIAEG